MTYGDFINKIYLPHKRNELKATSYNRLVSTYRYYCRTLADMDITLIKLDNVYSVLDTAKLNGLSKSVLDKIFEFFNNSFNYAFALDYIAKNPLICAKKYKSLKSKRVMEVYSNADITKLESCYNSFNGAYYVYSLPVLYLAGLRIGELLALDKSDIDLKNRCINVRKSYSYCYDFDVKEMRSDRTTTKTDSSVRSVPISYKLMPYIKMLLKYYPGIYFISSKVGTRVLPRNYTRTLERLCKIAGVECRGVHAFRHTFATNLIEKGVDVKIVSDLLGHSSVSMTMNMYVHTDFESRMKAVNIL